MRGAIQSAAEMTLRGEATSTSLVDATSVGTGVVPTIVMATIAIWLLGWIGRRVSHSIVRLGLGTRRTLSRVISFSQWGVGLLTLGWSLRVLLASLPTSMLSLVVIAAGLLALLATGTLSDIVGGLLAQFRFGLREGDQLTIGAMRGEVSQLDFARVHLRQVNGQELIIPGRRFLNDLVEIGPLRHATPVTVRASMARILQDGEVAHLREQLALLPYRVPQSPLRVMVDGQDLEIICHVWQQQSISHVEKAIVHACHNAFEELDSSGKE